MTRVKVCGITRVDDALAAVAAGADLLGFMFYRKSPRFLELDQAAAIAQKVPSGIGRVGVFVDEAQAVVHEAIKACRLDWLQFHGGETPEYCHSFKPLKIIKAFRIKDATSLAPLTNYPDTDTWLLDSYVKGQAGGTGACFNWDLAVQAKSSGRSILLAGGLKAENVAEAIRKVRPWGVDVSSGVECRPGIKDPQVVRQFIQEVKQADRGTGAD